MLSESHWKSLRQTLLVLFATMLLIGVTMLAISSDINPVGFFFLTVGGVCLIGYLISLVAEHWLKRHNPTDENSAAPGRHVEAGVNEAYEAPSYDEVAATGYVPTPAIWTINSSPGTSPGEPPPYSVVIEPPAHAETVVEAFSVPVAPGMRRASEADVQRLRLRVVLPPRLQRFVSDTHELKGTEERPERLEPLTPPPAYENVTEEEIFEEEFQPTRL
ncbi:hypothetical protein lerEdw1_009045 [Lerista edwardsae]|nr:hypothetical protein lerEdw1_009045 [Lerista edwardsae]